MKLNICKSALVLISGLVAFASCKPVDTPPEVVSPVFPKEVIKKKQKGFLWLALLVDLGLLIGIKYTNFLIENINGIKLLVKIILNSMDKHQHHLLLIHFLQDSLNIL